MSSCGTRTSTSFFVHSGQVAPLVINEFCAMNDGPLRDEAGDLDDWVEILNATPQGIDLEGLYLSDDPEQVSRFQTLIAPLRWDVGMGAIVLFIMTASFMLSGAAVLYPLKTEFKGWRLLTEQAHIWSNIHPSLVWGYYICIIVALWGTLQAIPEIYARVMQEVCQSI